MIARLLLFLLVSAVSFGQTDWYPITTEAQQSTKVTVTLSAPAAYRIGGPANNVWGPAILVTVTPTTFVNYADCVPTPPATSCPSGHPIDTDPGQTKIVQVAKTSVVQTVTIKDSNFNPVKVTTVTVPALVTPPVVPTISSYWNCVIAWYTDGSAKSVGTCTPATKP